MAVYRKFYARKFAAGKRIVLVCSAVSARTYLLEHMLSAAASEDHRLFATLAHTRRTLFPALSGQKLNKLQD